MEFSLFNLMTKPVDGSTHADVFNQMRNMTQMVDEAGFDVAWFAEHHLSNYCISPSPLMTAANMAAHTKRINVGRESGICRFSVELLTSVATLSKASGERV